MWSRRFLAKTQASSFKEILLGTTVVPIDTAALDKDAKKELRKKNDMIFSELLLSCTEEVAFGCVDTARTSDYAEGNCALSWKHLTARYESTSEATKVEVKRKFHESKLGKNEDPDEWISFLEKIRWRLQNCFKSNMDDDDLMIHIINNLSCEYEDIIAGIEYQMNNTTQPLTLQ